MGAEVLEIKNLKSLKKQGTEKLSCSLETKTPLLKTSVLGDFICWL